MKRQFLCLLVCFGMAVAQLRAEQVNMLQAGAVPDGKGLNTALINGTIDRLAEQGGGTLFFPAGTYLTGAVKLKSNITLELEAGATLLFSDRFDDYLPFVEMRHEGVLMKSFCPLIYAADAENITIKGRGTLDGQGKAWWTEFFRILVDLRDHGVRDLNKYQPMWDKANREYRLAEVTNEDYAGTLKRRFFRPSFIQPLRCKNIRIEGVTIINSPFWTVNPEFCQNVTVNGITIVNPPSPNTDGINPSSCKDVHISDCHISVGDDCITLKSGRDLQARQLGMACENITITNCTMLSGHGGVVIGSEMSGDVRRVTISNCVFDGTDRGIRIKSTRGRGGVVEDICVDNIVMKNIQREAIILNLFYSQMPEEPLSERTPAFRKIRISNLIATGVKTACRIAGIEEMPVEDVAFSNLHIVSEMGMEIDRVKNIQMHNVRVDAAQGVDFSFSHVDNAILDNLQTATPVKGKPLISLTDVKDVCIQGCFPVAGNSSFVRINGDNQGIILMNNALDRLPVVIDKESQYDRKTVILKNGL